MSQGLNHLTINKFSEKEQKIAFDIKGVDDDLCENESFYEVVGEYIIKLQGYLYDYINPPPYEELNSYSLDKILDCFLDGVFFNGFFEYLSHCAERMCEDLGCSFKLYGTVAFSALWFTAKGDVKKAGKFVIICFQPITSAMRISDVPKDAGRLGGRPEHPLKAEAVKLAKHKWSNMEYASLNIVATAVKHQLEMKYKSPPSLPAIKKWITAENIRPEKSIK
ncbi:hypothetical protein M942_05935 [Enterobacter ludwigii]|jgi:hypothetical protein|uniref:hypothetical protein n=1 Tax=Enterobacter ludwigii TaxID=299767 RepID=UPI0003D93662|nr:hypothetical protein [Enterobacter ludwigii]AHE72683.1 hypothetical protein M942_05935 [Enterobacter ludwigii]